MKQTKQLSSRILSFVITLAMIVGMLPLALLSVGAENPSGAPVPVSVSPENGAKDVSPWDTVIELTFAEAIDTSTVSEGILVRNMTNGTVVKGDFSFSASDTKVTFTKTGDFLSGCIYAVELTTALKTAVGVALAESLRYSFTVDGSYSFRPIADGVVSISNPDEVIGGDTLTLDADKMILVTYPAASIAEAESISLNFGASCEGTAAVAICAIPDYTVNEETLTYNTMPDLAAAIKVGAVNVHNGVNTIDLSILADKELGDRVTFVFYAESKHVQPLYIQDFEGQPIGKASQQDSYNFSYADATQITKRGSVVTQEATIVNDQNTTAGGSQSVTWILGSGGTGRMRFYNCVKTSAVSSADLGRHLKVTYNIRVAANSTITQSIYCSNGWTMASGSKSTYTITAAEGWKSVTYEFDITQAVIDAVGGPMFTIEATGDKNQIWVDDIVVTEEAAGNPVKITVDFEESKGSSREFAAQNRIWSETNFYAINGSPAAHGVGTNMENSTEGGKKAVKLTATNNYDCIKFFNVIKTSDLTTSDIGRIFHITMQVKSDLDTELTVGVRSFTAGEGSTVTIDSSGTKGPGTGPASSYSSAFCGTTRKIKVAASTGEWRTVSFYLVITEAMVTNQAGMLAVTTSGVTEKTVIWFDDIVATELLTDHTPVSGGGSGGTGDSTFSADSRESATRGMILFTENTSPVEFNIPGDIPTEEVEDIVIPTEPGEILGYQTTVNESGLASLRVIAAIDSLEYDYVGFYVTLYATKDGETVFGARNNARVYKAYTEINAGAESAKAEDFGCEYLTTVRIDNIDLSLEDIEILVTPYVVKEGVKTEGDDVVFCLTDNGEGKRPSVTYLHALGNPKYYSTKTIYTPAAMIADGYAKKLGRAGFSGNALLLDTPAAGIEFKVEVTGAGDVSVNMTTSASDRRIEYSVDGTTYSHYLLEAGAASYKLADNLSEGTHTIRIVLENGTIASGVTIDKITLGGTGVKTEDSPLFIEFIGDGTAEGVGLFDNIDTDATDAYAYLAAKILGADYSIAAKNGVTLAGFDGLFGKRNVNMTSSGAYTADRTPDLIVLGLGGGDNAQQNATDLGATIDALGEFFSDDAHEIPILVLTGFGGNTDGYNTLVTDYAGKGYDVKIVALTPDDAGLDGNPTAFGAAVQGTELAAAIRDEYPALIPAGVNAKDEIYLEVCAANATTGFNSFNVYVQTSDPSGDYYIRYKFQYEYNDNRTTYTSDSTTNRDSYRVKTGQLVKVNSFDGTTLNVTDILEVFQQGEISMALRQTNVDASELAAGATPNTNASDFVGGYHGDERLVDEDSARLYLDGEPIVIRNAEPGVYTGNVVAFDQESYVYKWGTSDETTFGVAALEHDQQFTVTKIGGLNDRQTVKWLTGKFSLVTSTSYMQMFTLNRVSGGKTVCEAVEAYDAYGKSLGKEVVDYTPEAQTNVLSSAKNRLVKYSSATSGISAEAGFLPVCGLENTGSYIAIRTYNDNKWYATFKSAENGATPAKDEIWTIDDHWKVDYTNPEQ